MAKRKTKKRSFDTHKKLAFAILLALFLLFAYLGNSYIQNRNNLLVPRIKSELKKYENNYNAKVFDKNDLSVWWISKDNLSIINDDSFGVELDVYNCEKDLESRPIFNKIAQELGKKVDKIAKESGLDTNIKNSSKDLKDTRFYDYVQAYEDENKKCTFVASPDCMAPIDSQLHYSFSFTCTEGFDKNYQNQSKFLKDLDLKDSVIHVQKKDGDFIDLAVNYRRSGYELIAKLIDGKWNKLFAGQDLPPCKIINQYQIPKQIASDCY